jgi:hypothetical protein
MVNERTEPFKIWKNPDGPGGSLIFMGDFYPPVEQDCFYQGDLQNLGFPPGHYTIRVPDSLRKRYVSPEWQKIVVPE